jgi:hypothetical protein
VRSPIRFVLLGGAALFLLSAPPAEGSIPLPGPGTQPTAAEVTPQDPDFLFRAPRLAFTIRTGLFTHRAQGAFFDVTTTRFSAERSDFRSFDFGAEAAIALSPRVDLTLGFDGGSTEVRHEDMEWLEADGSAVLQSTRLRRGPALQLGLRSYILPKGEQISNFAWLPATVAPFVGAGVGYTGYDLRQWGDFGYADPNDPDTGWIQYDDLNANGGATLAFLSGGADVTIRRNLALTLEARYQWSEANLRHDFSFTEPLDLSGLRLTAGLSVRY